MATAVRKTEILKKVEYYMKACVRFGKEFCRTRMPVLVFKDF